MSDKERIAQLEEALRSCHQVFTYYGQSVFGNSHFTDRHDDSGQCLRMADYITKVLNGETER